MSKISSISIDNPDFASTAPQLISTVFFLISVPNLLLSFIERFKVPASGPIWPPTPNHDLPTGPTPQCGPHIPYSSFYIHDKSYIFIVSLKDYDGYDDDYDYDDCDGDWQR